MQAQITAEREKRALIAKSEGQRQEEINLADGEKQAAVLRSEGEKQAAINKAQGEATAIRLIAEATAAGVRAVADAIGDKGGLEAANLKVAQQYVEAFARRPLRRDVVHPDYAQVSNGGWKTTRRSRIMRVV